MASSGSGRSRDGLDSDTERPTLGRRAGIPLLKAVAAFTGLVLAVQLVFGRVDIPIVDIDLLEVGAKQRPVPFGLIVNGVVVGSLYGLLAMGLILVYRANRVINFSQASLGSVPAVLGLILMTTRGWPYGLALVIAIIGGGVLGALVSGLIEVFRRAPRLIVTVVTIGVSLLLAFVEFYIPQWLSTRTLPPQDFPTPLSGMEFGIGIVTFTGDHLLTVLVVGGIVLALGAFFRYSDYGVAVRAASENTDWASLLGIPVRRLTVVVWVIAAIMSAIGVFLRAPLIGLPIGGFAGVSVLLFGLAAAVVARMESLPTAFLAGMAMGVIDQAAIFSTRRASLAQAVMFVVIIAALLFQRARVSRAREAAVSSFRMMGRYRPVPEQLRGLREVVIARRVVAVIVGGVAVAGPFLFGPGRESLASLILIHAIIGVSLVILTGWAGQISLGQFALAGIGAAVAAGLATKANQDFFVTLVAAGIAGAVVAIVVGLPALRIQGLFLAVSTLAFAFAVEKFVLDPQFFGWLLPGDFEFVERPVLYGRFGMESFVSFYYLCLGVLVLVLLMARSVWNSRSGRAFVGVQENTRSVQSYGMNVARTRLAAFALSGSIAALGGGLLAYHSTTVDAAGFSPDKSILIFVMIVVGGINSLVGAVVGAVFILGLPELPVLRNVQLVDLLTSSIGLIVVLLFLPGGLAEGMYRVRDWFLRWVADRHDLVVPSLVADEREEGEEGPGRREQGEGDLERTPVGSGRAEGAGHAGT